MSPAAETVPRSWQISAAAGLTFRASTPDDLPFLKTVYASTRMEELAPVPWTDAQKAAFLDGQFRAQDAHYKTHYGSAEFLLLLHGGQPIGRLYLDRWAREHRVIDIALLPSHRGRGYGSAILADVMDEARAAGKAVSIHVEKTNPALSLYRRLGFVAVGEHGIYDLMRWSEAQVKIAS